MPSRSVSWSRRNSACLDHLGVALGRRGLVLAERLLEALERRAQLELAEELAQARAVGRIRQALAEVDVDVDVAHGRGELLRHPRVLRVVGEVLLALRAGDLVNRLEHSLEAAEPLKELGSGLVADPGN